MDKIILTTGGTGGHIFPALAVGEVIRKNNPSAKLLFMGSNYGPESRLARAAGLEFYGLSARGLLGRGIKAFPAAFMLAKSFFEARKVIRDFAPSIIAGFGGYASFAPAMAAKSLGIPLLIHEQNAIAGMGNRFLGRFADAICVSQPATEGFAKTPILTGNPVREQIKRKIPGRSEKRLLIIGGSQGARGINKFMAERMPLFRQAGARIWHQCGEKDYAWLKEVYEREGDSSWRLAPFVENMGEAYDWADLAISRAGATAIAELCAVGLPSVLVPFPAAIRDHQTLNAKNLQKAGGAILIPEKDLDEAWARKIIELLGNEQNLKTMASRAASLGKMDAAEKIASEMQKIAKKNDKEN
ncbi:MAG: undecaprenyldiphospho-muramoylpentapeptide beta-N-acetylglucosaminyltransferase [Desulfovibrio sp.]|nr:undecaprenyldiphospho-muramoylpentapeptide beta-N-acetylglucosaminyltransferase [Desulfovibrio sp.]